MKKLITLLILITPAIVQSEQRVGQYVILVDNFSIVALDNMLKYAVDGSKDLGQPALRVQWTSQVSTNTNISGLDRKNYRDNTPTIDSETKEIYMEIDENIEGFHPIENFINQGKILKLGYFSFNRKGYNRDLLSEGNIYAAAIRRNE